MNTDSKLKRFIVLLDKAPFILFLERETYPSVKDNLDVVSTISILEETKLTKVFSVINILPDPLAYSITDALANAFSTAYAFPIPYFTSAIWQEHIDWKNVDTKPEPTKDVVIVVCKLTHDLRIFNGEKPVNLDCDGEIVLNCLDSSVPFPLALLKECIMEIYDIIVIMSIDRITVDKTKSKYLSVMQTWHDTFNWVNLRHIEKDLRSILKAFGIKIEEPTEE